MVSIGTKLWKIRDSSVPYEVTFQKLIMGNIKKGCQIGLIAQLAQKNLTPIHNHAVSKMRVF